jgi:hypothetical protein
MVAQTDAKQSAAESSSRRSYDLFLKEHALKILIDYARATGKKWSTIRNEVLAFSSVQPTPDYQMISRQDFESWARGDSVLGDSKFSHVYRFLTHPDTLARPELAHASILQEQMHLLVRTGRVLDEFFGVPPLKTKGKVYESNLLEGLYSAQYEGKLLYLSLTRIREERVLIAHLLEPQAAEAPNGDNWNTSRKSGFVTVGKTPIVHLKDVSTRQSEAFPFNITLKMPGKYTLSIIHPKYVLDALEEMSRGIMIFGRIRSARFDQCILEFVKTSEPHIEKMIDRFKWRV